MQAGHGRWWWGGPAANTLPPTAQLAHTVPSPASRSPAGMCIPTPVPTPAPRSSKLCHHSPVHCDLSARQVVSWVLSWLVPAWQPSRAPSAASLPAAASSLPVSHSVICSSRAAAGRGGRSGRAHRGVGGRRGEGQHGVRCDQYRHGQPQPCPTTTATPPAPHCLTVVLLRLLEPLLALIQHSIGALQVGGAQAGGPLVVLRLQGAG